MRMTSIGLVCIAAAALSDRSAQATIRISEWMYSPGSGGIAEFVEITNFGASPVDMTGWSFADNGRVIGAFDLSVLGTLAVGESAIITETFSADDFHAEWGTPATLKVAAGNTTNIGRSDELNIYDAGMNLVDRLTYGDQAFPGTIRTQGASGNPNTIGALGANDPARWTLSTVGDSYGSFASAGGDIGNPGVAQISVPEPTGVALAAFGVATLVRRRRRAD